jgi:hypothetical protein
MVREFEEVANGRYSAVLVEFSAGVQIVDRKRNPARRFESFTRRHN